MKSLYRILSVLLISFIAVPAFAEIIVQTKDMDCSPTGQNWRRLAFLLTNDSSDDVDMATSDGDVTVKGLQAKNVEMSTSDGDILAKDLSATSIEIKTSDGDVDVSASGEELYARTSDGDITIQIDDKMAVSLSTSDGNITLNGPSDLQADLNLRGDRVKLVGGLNIQGEVSTRRVVGKLNNGGPKIQAKASDGIISLKLR